MKHAGLVLTAVTLFIGVSALARGKAKRATPTHKKSAAPTYRPSNPLSKVPGALGPLPAGAQVASAHAPFEAGDCSICHQRDDKKNPGPINMPVNELCFSCHDELQDQINKREYKHPAAQQSCVNCHDPHDSRYPKLLIADTKTLCLSCHADIKKIVDTAKVSHGALDTEKSCANCHNPHAANVEKLLIEMPFDLCLSCHDTGDIEDHDGKKLTDMKKLLDTHKVWHAPVAAKDCSACHQPHGSANFRLLVLPYPAKFYSPYDPKNYALCFNCHDDQMLADPRTTTLTSFRNGDLNLHYVHVHQERGRTCRACHDIHAANQLHLIRDGVPYGPKGWILKLHYTKTPTGGYCTRTCHQKHEYNNTVSVEPKK